MARKKVVSKVPVVAVIAADSAYEEALERAKDPAMVIGGDNPLVDNSGEDVNVKAIQRINMDRFHQDADLRRKPGTGNVYAGFMANRFGG